MSKYTHTPRFCKDCGVAVEPYKHFCPACADTRQRANVAKYQRKQQVAMSQWMKDTKAKSGCALCGESFTPALDYHHRDPSLKSYAVGTMYNRTVKRVKEEMAKCILLCSNCHRKVHGPIPTP